MRPSATCWARKVRAPRVATFFSNRYLAANSVLVIGVPLTVRYRHGPAARASLRCPCGDQLFAQPFPESAQSARVFIHIERIWGARSDHRIRDHLIFPLGGTQYSVGRADPPQRQPLNRAPDFPPNRSKDERMKQLSRVVWNEGMHLAQHHFQAQSRYFEDAIQFAVSALFFEPYGFAGFELDAEALRNDRVSLVHARGIFPDGLPFDIPASDAQPAPLPIRELFSPTRESHLVLLTIPAYRMDRANFALNGETE